MASFEQTPGAEQPPRRKSRKWLWLILAIPLVLIVLCAGLCGGIFAMVFGVMKSSEPYQTALKQVQEDPLVIEKLGEPIEDVTWFPSGSVNTENDRGDANLHFQVAGPKGNAGVHVQARRVDGQWGLTTLEVTPEGGERILLDTGAGGGIGEAPKWPPVQPAVEE